MTHLDIFFKKFKYVIISSDKGKPNQEFYCYDKLKAWNIDKNLKNTGKDYMDSNILVIYRIGQHIGVDIKN